MAITSWALRRQIFYVLVLILFFSIVGFLILYPKLNMAPNCSDGKQNGTETGIDCGGSCLNACLNQMDTISILWSRSFKVVPGRYNALAYLVNHNRNAVIENINYRFTFHDANNIYIGKRDGSTFVPPGGNFAIFEPGIDIGNSIPVYVDFEFTDKVPQWQQVSQEKINQLKVLISNIQLADEDISPKLSASIKNNSLFTIPNVNIVAILYNGEGNAISTSRTFLDQLNPLQDVDINFTWPEPLPGKVVVKEIIPIYNIFSVKLQ
ncbi:MAG: hypothetical protein WCW93_00265 [Candidatus Paceibacterota bacterium]